jgi:hypothetical protein
MPPPTLPPTLVAQWNKLNSTFPQLFNGSAMPTNVMEMMSVLAAAKTAAPRPAGKTMSDSTASSRPTPVRVIKDDSESSNSDDDETVKASDVQQAPPVMGINSAIRALVGDNATNFAAIKQEFVRGLIQTNLSAEAVKRYSDAFERTVKAQFEMDGRLNSLNNSALPPRPLPVFFNATGARILNATKEKEVVAERANRNMMTLMAETAATTYGSRNVTNIKVEPQDFRLDTRRVDGTKGNLRFTFTTKGVPSARLRFLTNESLEADGFDSGYSFRVGFLRLVETDDAHTLKNTTRSMNFPAYPNSWSPLRFSQTTMDGATYRTIASSFTPGGIWDKLNVTLVFYVANDVVPLDDGSIIRPNSFKYSVFIEGWKYVYPQGRLVLMNIMTTLSNDVSYNSETGAIELDAKTGALAWDTSIVADGEPANVDIIGFRPVAALSPNVTGDRMFLPEESTYLLAFRYPARANVLLWDPEAVINEAVAPQYTTATAEVLINYEYDTPQDQSVKASAASQVQFSLMSLVIAIASLFVF